MKVIRAYAARCDKLDHVEVELSRAKAQGRADLFNRHMHSCRPHRVVRMAAVDDIVTTLRNAMLKHGCVPKCEVCRWAAHVIAALWRT